MVINCLVIASLSFNPAYRMSFSFIPNLLAISLIASIVFQPFFSKVKAQYLPVSENFSSLISVTIKSSGICFCRIKVRLISDKLLNLSVKTIFVILDGAADLPCKKLNWKTPLEAANKPNLDYFTQNGVMGQVQTVGKNIAPESDVAVFALLGYNPFKSFSGRGPLEASGAGIKL